ncbi:MAG TPA: Dynamin family protein [Cyanobacteria bacterium UBA8553]|nr:Dynamin family protein [Cyanobacteria bacterium UBA8553]HAJ62696.1 Dynamin family protein [Cyanobacteria bacterium UBA8543]
MAGYNDHLQFVAKVIGRSDIPESVRIELHPLIERIQQRQSDPNLYLAVIGEFSSGKSTFINALLRDDLLKTSALVTTAAATRLRYGRNLQMVVRFKAPQPRIIKVNRYNKVKVNRQTGKVTVAWLPWCPGLKIRQFIHVVTSDDEVAKNVFNVTIAHPAQFIANGIVIIDTPGTNATNPKHAAITRDVVENEADAAIIIVPATMPLTQTFTDFLAGPVRSYLHRCIFVVTRMDQIRPREHNRLLENVRVRLAESLRIDHPKLHLCSAQVVMDNLSGDVQVEKGLRIWIDEFAQMESEIISRLRYERSESIKESIGRLFNQLFDQLDSHLRSQWNQYHARQAAIQREIIQDLNSFADQQHRECRRRIEDAVSRTGYKIDDCINSHRDRTISTIRNAIFGASDWDDLKWVLGSRVETILKDDQQSLRADVQRDCNKLSQAAEEAGRYFDQKFSEAYRRLQALGGRVETNSASASSSIQLNTYSVVYSAQELNSKNFGNSVKGFFSHLFRGLLNERKQKLWDEIRPNIYTYFDTIKKQAQQAVQTDAQNVTVALNRRIDAYITQYKTVVDAMLNEQKVELQRLTKLQESIQTDLSEIERRRNYL